MNEDPPTDEEKQAIRQERLDRGGAKNFLLACSKLSKLSDEQINYWFSTTSWFLRIDLFDSLRDREPTEEMLRWISNPQRHKKMVQARPRNTCRQRQIKKFIKMMLKYADPDTIEPDLVEIAKEAGRNDIVDILQEDPRFQ
jgi:hypothetical protein